MHLLKHHIEPSDEDSSEMANTDPAWNPLPLGPLRLAFIDFFYGSRYTAGFGQNRMSALGVEPVYKKKNNRYVYRHSTRVVSDTFPLSPSHNQ
jgi:hypothetical protein